MANSYSDFIADKTKQLAPAGFDPETLSEHLFPFQRDIVGWALRRGKGAVFADTGLGKTPMMLEWAKHVAAPTGKPVLILAPLAVAKQIAREGEKFHLAVTYARDLNDAPDDRIVVTNYERLDKFPAHHFGGVVIDESSILKSFDGKTRDRIIEAFQDTPFRLACTATPAPNDTTELGNHAEFLGVMTRAEMLAMYFFHDGGDTSKWTLKGHARESFWKWVASWAVVVRRPSDVHPDYDDERFKLPPIEYHCHTIKADPASALASGSLFVEPATTLTEQRKVRRETLGERCKLAAGLVPADDACLVWCELNDEADALAGAIDGAVEVRGNDDADFKEDSVSWFTGCQEEKPCRRKKRNAPTAENGTNETRSVSESTTDFVDLNEMRDDANGTLLILPTGIESSAASESASFGILIPNSAAGSASTESLQSNTENSSPSNAAHAPSAETIKQTPEDTGSTSITAIEPGASEGYSAEPATSGSENSERAESASNEHSNTSRVLISKSRIFGYGMNLQTCCRMIFVGITHSWESYYQAVRRCYRFGQLRPVRVDIVTSELEGKVLENLKRKEAEAAEMSEEMVRLTRDQMRIELGTMTPPKDQSYSESVKSGADWTMHHGDCVEVLKRVPTSSVDYTIFSPPFASLYTYSDSMRDMGNCATHDEFYEHFRFLVPELLRVTKPGRLVSFHCMNLPTSKSRDGFIGLTDFRGILIKAFQSAGWIFHSEVCIWKDPVTAMQRTHAIGLLYKQLRKDSTISRQGIPDYLVTMRAPGENATPVSHVAENFPVEQWQKWASPVWMDINPSDTLQKRSAREEEDERHICPLQLEVIRRGIGLWSNPGDLVLSPFGGIGSEGYVALQEGRQFLGVELKQSYWKQACLNLEAISKGTKKQLDLFGGAS